MSRILVLAPYPPYPPRGGGAQRIYQLVRGLAARHELTCLAFAPGPEAAEALAPLRQLCRLEVVLGPTPRSLARRALTTLASTLPDMALRNASKDYAARLAALLAEPFDIVQAESIEMARYLDGIARSGPPGRAGRRRPWLVLDQFNAEYLLQKRAALNSLGALAPPNTLAAAPRAQLRNLLGAGYSLAQWRKLARYERRLIGLADATVVVSAEDLRALREVAGPFRSAVVPNGVDCAFFTPSPAAHNDAPSLVFTGTLDYRPNVDAVCWFASEVLPRLRARRPELRLRLVGRAPTPAVRALAADPAVEVTGEVADVRPYIAAAAVYIVPMRIGGGIRLKLLEALAMQAPVVSTALGAEGVVGLVPGEHCLIADDAGAFAEAVLRLIDHPARARQLGLAGRRLAAAYDWPLIVPRLDALYAELAAASPPSSPEQRGRASTR
jgi:polysaccharide biosynthesis protein PslH